MPVITSLFGFVSSFEKANVCSAKAPRQPHSWQVISHPSLSRLKKEHLTFCLPSRGNHFIVSRSRVRNPFGDGRQCLEISLAQCPSLSPVRKTRSVLTLD
ncbi:unnamed protein product [Rangifer tarandus platyrhynchus]|uniref:Uncharacterized protein n=2 Tax=Rangifer tarandus platyrhynchus TaxID=3082113 RepID=A0ABN8YL73_RANTA|nr:unnamed protein product [Rangifer tarandus platyrhynchus]